MKQIVILGSTGSVGRQTIDVIRDAALRGQELSVRAITAKCGVKIMEEQARLLLSLGVFDHGRCVLTDEDAAADLALRLADTPISVCGGRTAQLEAAADPEADLVYNSIGQSAGLEPTLCALDAGRTLALANKESLVIAGSHVMKKAADHGCTVIPVDSEHSAIFQCLQGSRREDLSRILLTASGGPFFGMTRDQMKDITPERALAHPTWQMGARITVDSATLMNKGFEVIEAVHLFGVAPDQIEVVIHRESIIHSMVEYTDRAVIAQMSVPDMRLCSQYALNYPARLPGPMERLDLKGLGRLTFYEPDFESFPLLGLAFEAIRLGGSMGAVINAADEAAVQAFLDRRIGFDAIASVVMKTASHFAGRAAIEEPSVEEILADAAEASALASQFCRSC